MNQLMTAMSPNIVKICNGHSAELKCKEMYFL